MWSDLLAALALLLVLEGLLPFLAPNRYREYLLEMSRFPARNLRIMGLVFMILGLLLLTWVRG
jgi:uncharacterized protein YjeT (DUF2065 family)